MNFDIKPFHHRLGPSGLSMLFVLACSTGCPGDDTGVVTTTGEDDSSTGSLTTGGTPPTVTVTETMPPMDTTDSGMDGTDTSTGGMSEESTAGETEEPTCGNGVLDDGEECDGDELDRQDCTTQGFAGGDLACNDDCTYDTAACTNCGNDAIDEGEECDGTDLGGLDCPTLDAVYDRGELGCAADCTYDVGMCVTWECGDDMINGADVCDGADLGGEDCVTQGFDGGTLACEMGCAAFDTSGCFACGDGVTNGAEVCDGADVGGEDCVSQGFDGGTLGCALDCGGYDTSGCYVCGDDAIGGPEVCDGLDLDGEDCVSLGFGGGGTLSCAPDCSGFDTGMCIAEFCGDGIVNGAEQCEPGLLGGETCISQGFGGGTLDCDPVTCLYDVSGCNDCGNGVVDPGEACDGADLGGLDCVSQGFLGGGLGCAADCSGLVTDACFDNVTTVCSTPAVPIGPGPGDPDAVDILNVVGNGDALVDVDVFVDASHTWSGDMEIDVRYVPGDETVRVFDNACGNQDNMLVTFDDQAAGPPSCGSPVGGGGTGTPFEPLAAFYNWADGSGDWEITINDTVGGDGGTLNEWCVNLGTNSTAPVCGNGDIEGLETCDATALAQTTCEDLGFVGGSLDCAGNCGFDTSECSNGVVAICATPGSPITTGAPVNEVLNLADPGNVGDIDVFLDIQHTWDADLDIAFVNVGTGTTVELTTDQCGSGDDVFAFFNDEGNGLPDCNAPIAIEGNINPEGPGAMSDFDGLPIAGDWELQIVDDAGGDDGVLNEWCIYITPA